QRFGRRFGRWSRRDNPDLLRRLVLIAGSEKLVFDQLILREDFGDRLLIESLIGWFIAPRFAIQIFRWRRGLFVLLFLFTHIAVVRPPARQSLRPAVVRLPARQSLRPAGLRRFVRQADPRPPVARPTVCGRRCRRTARVESDKPSTL